MFGLLNLIRLINKMRSFYRYFAVFCLYKSFTSFEIIEGIDPTKFSIYADKPKADVEVNHEELTSSYNELHEAKQRLKLLEMKIQTLESRISKTYPDVTFLNYKNRKRILVSHLRNKLKRSHIHIIRRIILMLCYGTGKYLLKLVKGENGTAIICEKWGKMVKNRKKMEKNRENVIFSN